MALKDLTKTEAIDRLQRARSSLANKRKEAEAIAGRVVDATVGIGGGVASGIIRGYNDDGSAMTVPGTDVPLDIAMAGVFIAVGATGMAGEASRPLNSLGVGMGAAAAAFGTRDAVQRAKKEGKL